MENNKDELVLDMNVANVTAAAPYLRADKFKDGQTLRGIKILEVVGYEKEHEKELLDVKTQKMEKKLFKESWTVQVEYSGEKTALRLNAKHVVTMRDDLKFGPDMGKWTGKIFDMSVRDYNVGKGFVIMV